MRRNRMSLDEDRVPPARVLRNVATDPFHRAVWPRKLRLPVMIAPVGALEIFDPAAGAAVARAAGTFGAVHMLRLGFGAGAREHRKGRARCAAHLSALCARRRRLVEDVVSRTIASGYAAFCLTVDTAHYSRRERDIAKRYVRESRLRDRRRFQKGLEWRTVKLIKDEFKFARHQGSPPRKTRRLRSISVDWIYVSNHGGPPAIMAAARCMYCPRSFRRLPTVPRSSVDSSFCREHRYREGDRLRRRPRRHRSPAMLSARGRGRNRHGAHAGVLEDRK